MTTASLTLFSFKIFYSNALLKLFTFNLFTFNLVYIVIYIFRNLIYLSIYINACCITVFIPFTFLAIYCLNFNSCIYFSILALCITYPNKLTYTIKYEYNFLLLVGIENIYLKVYNNLTQLFLMIMWSFKSGKGLI